MLATLLIEPGIAVSLDQLVDRVWGATPPRSARQTLHSYVSRLRSVLRDEGGPNLEHRSGSYVLEADHSAVDLHRFRALVARAGRADDADAAELWQEAMALWQGRPFTGLDSDWLRSVADRLEAERWAATLDHNDLLLRCGDHARILPSLADATRNHPLDERLAGQLILALYRCDRQADALARYRQVQENLADELGSDPGPALRELYQRILRQDRELVAPAAVAGPDARDPGRSHPDVEAGDDDVADAGAVQDDAADGAADDSPAAAERAHRPAQLPLDAAGFMGRTQELRRLDELLPGIEDDQAAPTVTIAAISGTAGVGKTALAVRWAHQVADRFPDGQLYVNLRGYDPDQPMRPADVLARFLAALGVAEPDIPVDGDERAARYRSELAGRRILIVLDNAGSVAQVRPLLPGSGTSVVVVTSRDSLAGLVAVHGAHQVDLDLLPAADAVGLLCQLIGPRVEAEPTAAATLADQCARLPLALRVAAVLATSRPDRTLAEVVAELTDRQERLELLDPGGDPYAAVHTVFSWSIQKLPEPVARTFRRLGLHPGPDLDPYVAAALTGMEPRQANRILEALVNAHLLHRTGPDRYAMHDLLRAYATHLSAGEDTAEDREAAQRQLFDYYQTAALAAVDLLYPNEVVDRRESRGADIRIPDLVGADVAREWLETEWLSIVAIVGHGAHAGVSDDVQWIVRTVSVYAGEAHFTDLLTINAAALRAARRTGDPAGQAHALRRLGVGYTRLGEYEVSTEHASQALTLFRQVGNLIGVALTLSNLGGAENLRGRYKNALDYHRESVAVYRQTTDRHGEAVALNNLGLSEARLGNLAVSVEVQYQALAIFRDLGSRFSEAVTLSNIAAAETRLERYLVAADLLHQSIAISQEMGSYRNRANALDTLGSLHLRLHEPEEARKCFQEALACFREIGERSSQAWSMNGLGEVAQFAGDPFRALSLHTDALAIAAAVGSRHQQARAHAGVGNAHHTLGDTDLARTHYENAHRIYAELDMPEAADMRVQIDEVSAPLLPCDRSG